MKTYKILKLLIAMTVSLPVLSQTNPRLGNMNYKYNAFFESFSGNQLDRNKWKVEPFKRGLGVLADDPRTIQVLDGNLKLNMIYSPNYSSGGYTGDYVGGEIISMNSYSYGIFECYAKFAHQNGSQPAFWLFNGDGLLALRVVLEVKLILLNYYAIQFVLLKLLTM